MRILAVLAVVVVAATGCSKKQAQEKEAPPAPAPTTAPAPAPAPSVPAQTGALDEEAFKALHTLRADQAPPRTGEVIDLAGTKAYLALPKHAKGPVPGLVVIHEWWGLNEHIEHWADRLAEAGFAAIAIDLYGGTVATSPDEAMAAMKAVDEAAAGKTIDAALAYLANDPRIQAPKRGVIGWCFGGGWSLQTALAHPELDAAVIYYGQLESDPAKLKNIKAKVVGVFGKRDTGIPPDKVAAFDAALTTAGVEHQIYEYDAEHAFANPSGGRYDERSAAEAWSHVLPFLQTTLGANAR